MQAVGAPFDSSSYWKTHAFYHTRAFDWKAPKYRKVVFKVGGRAQKYLVWHRLLFLQFRLGEMSSPFDPYGENTGDRATMRLICGKRYV